MMISISKILLGINSWWPNSLRRKQIFHTIPGGLEIKAIVEYIECFKIKDRRQKIWAKRKIPHSSCSNWCILNQLINWLFLINLTIIIYTDVKKSLNMLTFRNSFIKSYRNFSQYTFLNLIA
jgi:hypothetical protein